MFCALLKEESPATSLVPLFFFLLIPFSVRSVLSDVLFLADSVVWLLCDLTFEKCSHQNALLCWCCNTVANDVCLFLCLFAQNRFGWDYSGNSNLTELQLLLEDSIMLR